MNNLNIDSKQHFVNTNVERWSNRCLVRSDLIFVNAKLRQKRLKEGTKGCLNSLVGSGIYMYCITTILRANGFQCSLLQPHIEKGKGTKEGREKPFIAEYKLEIYLPKLQTLAIIAITLSRVQGEVLH
jgi:hypothetical protein